MTGISVPEGVFNIRVYGLLSQSGHLLTCREEFLGREITKFPGGGLEFGEGLADGLKRELQEELNLIPDYVSHLYTTDFFVQSERRQAEQVIAVYYIIRSNTILSFPSTVQPTGLKDNPIALEWIAFGDLEPALFDMPADQEAVRRFIAGLSSAFRP